MAIAILWLFAAAFVVILLNSCATIPRIPRIVGKEQSRTYRVEHRIFGVTVWETTATIKEEKP
jgi:hypothetical protein